MLEGRAAVSLAWAPISKSERAANRQMSDFMGVSDLGLVCGCRNGYHLRVTAANTCRGGV